MSYLDLDNDFKQVSNETAKCYSEIELYGKSFEFVKKLSSYLDNTIGAK